MTRPITEQMLLSEIDWLKDQLPLSQADYLSADRRGRGFGLNAEQRQRMWTAVGNYQRILEQQGVWIGAMFRSTSGSLSREKDRTAPVRYRSGGRSPVLCASVGQPYPEGAQTAKFAPVPGGRPYPGLLRSQSNLEILGIRSSWTVLPVATQLSYNPRNHAIRHFVLPAAPF